MKINRIWQYKIVLYLIFKSTCEIYIVLTVIESLLVRIWLLSG